MAGHQAHAAELAHVPGIDDDASRVRIAPQQLDGLSDLIDAVPIGRGPCAPLLPVDRPELPVLIGPLVPDADAMLPEPADIRVATQEPQELVDDGTQMDLLRRDQRKSRSQVESHLLPEQGQRAGAGAVVLGDAGVADAAQQVEVCLHCATARLPEGTRARRAHHSSATPPRIMGSDSSWPIVNQPPAR